IAALGAALLLPALAGAEATSDPNQAAAAAQARAAAKAQATTAARIQDAKNAAKRAQAARELELKKQLDRVRAQKKAVGDPVNNLLGKLNGGWGASPFFANELLVERLPNEQPIEIDLDNATVADAVKQVAARALAGGTVEVEPDTPGEARV